MMEMTKYFVPGRVNLIGEHIDYNGGMVLPIGLNMGIKATYTGREDHIISLTSATHAEQMQFSTSSIPSAYEPQNNWCNYPIGVISAIYKSGVPISGFDLTFDSDLPEGSGLSSSAAIEVVTAYILLHQSKKEIYLPDIAVLCQKVENEFIGVKCGIMDQFAVANAQKDHALLLNCDTLAFEQIPFDLDGYSLLVINSKKPRSLIKSAYNERKAESDDARRIFIQANKLQDIQYLVDAEMEDLPLISDPIIQRRARHVISENIRVRHSVAALRMGDLHTFGRLMNASHRSMKEDYEITGAEMDMLAETAQYIDGCLGARMTGGGFGGCVIALVKKGHIESFKNILTARYHTATDVRCEIYECQAEAGVRII
jgi:galactokinase